jgi:thiol-disulfide isomerase/thioredoxin
MTFIQTDDELSAFFQDNELAVITYFLEEECEGCEELLPVFEEISEEETFSKIRFGLMLAEPGSIAENLVKQRQVPFVAIYKNGEMIKCGSVNSEKEFRKMLRKF